MKRAFVGFALLALLASLVVALPAQAQLSFKYDRINTAGNAYVDTLLWHTGVSYAKVCTLKATEKDTSQRFPMEGIDIFSAAFKHTHVEGTAGGTIALTCSLQVSLDGTNWFTQTPGIPLYSVATSAGATIIREAMVVYSAPGDSAVTITDIAGPRGRAYVQGSKWARFIVAQAAGTLDTTFFRGQDFRMYKR